MMERFYAILSGDSPTLSREELKAILDVESRLYRVEGFLKASLFSRLI
ncbi:hypothetical protein [Aeropyrum camini]|nr:hypothetical protein [Aeropyrum camini]